MRFWKESLQVKLVSYFLLLSMATVSLVGFTTYTQARSALMQSVWERLDAVASLKEAQLISWADEQKRDVEFIASLPQLRSQAADLLSERESQGNIPSDSHQETYSSLAALLNEVIERMPNLKEIFLLSQVGGEILISTESSNEGSYRVMDTYYSEGAHGTFVEKVYPSPVTGQPTMTIATPLFDGKGNLIAVLAAHLNIDHLDNVIRERSGLGVTGETYLIDNYNVFVSSQDYGRKEFPRGVHSEGIDTAIKGIRGTALYENYNGVPVLGNFRWIDELGLALLAEMTQEEAFAPAGRLAARTLGIGAISAVFLTVGVYLLARQIIRPISAITQAAVSVAGGDLTPVADVTTEDEVGILAKAYNEMTKQLGTLYSSLELKVAELQVAEKELREARDRLEIRVSERTAELTMLNRSSQALVSALDLDQVLITALEELRHLLRADASSVWLIDPKSRELVCWQSSGPMSSEIKGWRLPPGVGIIGWVAQHGASQLTGDAQVDRRHYLDLDQKTQMPARSLLTLPLIVKGNTIGAIQVIDSQANRFDESDLALMESLAAPAAIAIENAKLYQQARKDAETKTILLREVNHRVKNNLSAIIGLLYAERRHSDMKDMATYQSIMQDLISRVQGLAAAHTLLSESEWSPLPLSKLTTQIIHSSMRALPHGKQLRVEVSPADVCVTPDQAGKLALIINELVTNTIKYALRDRQEGLFAVNIEQFNDSIRVQFLDDGPGYSEDVLRAENPKYSVGFHLMDNIVHRNLNGSLKLENRKSSDGGTGGACTTIQFPSIASCDDEE